MICKHILLIIFFSVSELIPRNKMVSYIALSQSRFNIIFCTHLNRYTCSVRDLFVGNFIFK